MKKSLFSIVTAAVLALSTTAMAEESPKAYQPPAYELSIPTEIRLSDGSSLPLAAGNEPLTIEEAVSLGLEQHESIQEARAAVAQALARIEQSRAPARPNLNLSASYQDPLYFHAESANSGLSNLNIPGLSGAGSFASFFAQAPEGTQESLSLRQLLFDFNQTRSSVRSAKAQARAAEAGVRIARQDLAYQIRSAFLQLLNSQRLAKVRMMAVENQAVHIEEARKLFDAGIGLPVDVVRAQTEYAKQVNEFTKQRNQALMDRVKLAALLGVDPRTPFEIEEPAIEVDPDVQLQGLVDQALADKPGLAQTEAQLESQKYQLENAKASNNPRLTASLNFSGNQVTPQPRTESLSLMFNLEWPLYDGGLAAAKADEARAAIEQYSARLTREQREVVEQVSNAYIQMQTAMQTLQTSDVQVKGAEESVRVASGRYRLGLSTFVEVLDAEQSLLTARTDRVNSLAQLEMAEAELKHAIGQSE